MQKIGFVGLGTMGFPMAKNLIKAGYTLTVYNRTRERAEPLEILGAKIASSPADVAKQSAVVFTMLTADMAVNEVILGPQGIKAGASAGLIVIDSSTISPGTSQKIAEELGKLQVDVLDAPVTGSEPQAIDGILTFMVGGKAEVYEKCRPLFEAMGKGSYYMGVNGKGSYTKLANNLMSAINMVSFAEAIVFAAKAGVDPQLFVDVVSGGGARSGMVDNKAPKILSGDFQPNFSAALMYKDVGLASDVAKTLNIPLPAAAIVKEMLNMTIAKGYGQEDVCSVIKCYEEWAHTEVRK
jgi:3-hydroxyisobutyrate dehydrogenase-like beta-hydroxyacid dehydrogenase